MFSKKKDLREAVIKKMAERCPAEPVRGVYEGPSSGTSKDETPRLTGAVVTKAQPVRVVAPEVTIDSSDDSEGPVLRRKRGRSEGALLLLQALLVGFVYRFCNCLISSSVFRFVGVEGLEVSSDSCPSSALDKGKKVILEEESSSPARGFGEPLGLMADARRAVVAPRTAVKRPHKVSKDLEGLDPRFEPQLYEDYRRELRAKAFSRKGLALREAWDPIMGLTRDESILLGEEEVRLRVAEGLLFPRDRHFVKYTTTGTLEMAKDLCQSAIRVSLNPGLLYFY